MERWLIWLEKFNEEFKDQGIQAKVNEVAYADLKTQIQNRAAVGELPALVKISELAQYVDYVHPLDESSLSKEEFLLNGTINGTFYAPTVNTTAVGMLINKTAFDEAGVAYPTSEEERWTWDEFEAAVKEVVEKERQSKYWLCVGSFAAASEHCVISVWNAVLRSGRS